MISCFETPYIPVRKFALVASFFLGSYIEFASTSGFRKMAILLLLLLLLLLLWVIETDISEIVVAGNFINFNIILKIVYSFEVIDRR